MHCYRHFPVVQTEDVRAYIQYHTLSLNTTKLYLIKLTAGVDANILRSLTDKFALIFNWQATPEAHYLAVFSNFPAECSLGYGSAHLTLSSLHDEQHKEWKSIYRFWGFCLICSESSWKTLSQSLRTIAIGISKWVTGWKFLSWAAQPIVFDWL